MEMVTIPAGRYRVGSDEHYPEERPAREVEVSAFRMDVSPVTNRDFAAFVAATGWVTVAERATPAGSAVFVMSAGPVDLRDPSPQVAPVHRSAALAVGLKSGPWCRFGVHVIHLESTLEAQVFRHDL